MIALIYMNDERGQGSTHDYIGQFIDDVVERELQGEICFGKYKGRRIAEVYEFDKSYCAWLFRQSNISPTIRDYLSSRISGNELFLGFGKYKNKSLSDIAKTDLNYIKWLRDNDIVKHKHPKMHEALMKF